MFLYDPKTTSVYEISIHTHKVEIYTIAGYPSTGYQIWSSYTEKWIYIYDICYNEVYKWSIAEKKVETKKEVIK